MGAEVIQLDQETIRITKLECTCSACPSQWQGRTDDGRSVYIRYRWGYGTVDVNSERVFSFSRGDSLDGLLGLDDLKSELPTWITISDDLDDDEDI